MGAGQLVTTSRFLLGDSRAVVDSLPENSVDLVLTSPPFLALRSYLPADHPAKGSEIGAEPTPAAYIDTLLDCTEGWARVLAPHGSICVELGDTFSGSGGAGGDYGENGLRQGQNGFTGSSARSRHEQPRQWSGGHGCPLDKSLCGIPSLYANSLAYGRNLLRPERTTDPWRVRNQVVWVRNNPPVGALGDKVRPATSYLTMATKARDRWFDLDAVRTEPTRDPATYNGNGYTKGNPSGSGETNAMPGNQGGAPPLDWWLVNPRGYSGKVSTTRRVRCEPGDGGERTTSPDCPVHADLPGQLPKALRDERAAAQSPRIPRTDDRPAQGQLGGCAPTDESPDRSGSSPSPTSERSGPQCSPAATPHSTASSRTDPAPATSPPGTASGRSSGRTGDTPASLQSGELHPDTPESRTSAKACPPEGDPETDAGTAGTEDRRSACSCSYWRTITESTSHYAVWPAELLGRPIQMMCPRRVCRTCGQPSRRLVDAQRTLDGAPAALPPISTSGRGSADADGVGHWRKGTEYTTTGWTTCGCEGTDGLRLDGWHAGDGWRPGMVLDPFVGSGTTLVVAHGLSRSGIGIDIDERNADLARERVGMWLEVETTCR